VLRFRPPREEANHFSLRYKIILLHDVNLAFVLHDLTLLACALELTVVIVLSFSLSRYSSWTIIATLIYPRLVLGDLATQLIVGSS
jgi:hypothetical protein